MAQAVLELETSCGSHVSTFSGLEALCHFGRTHCYLLCCLAQSLQLSLEGIWLL